MKLTEMRTKHFGPNLISQYGEERSLGSREAPQPPLLAVVPACWCPSLEAGVGGHPRLQCFPTVVPMGLGTRPGPRPLGASLAAGQREKPGPWRRRGPEGVPSQNSGEGEWELGDFLEAAEAQTEWWLA